MQRPIQIDTKRRDSNKDKVAGLRKEQRAGEELTLNPEEQYDKCYHSNVFITQELTTCSL